MDFQLGLTATECGQHSESDQLSLLWIQARSGVDVSEAVLDDVASEVGGDITKGFDHSMAGLAVDGVEHLLAIGESLVVASGLWWEIDHGLGSSWICRDSSSE